MAPKNHLASAIGVLIIVSMYGLAFTGLELPAIGGIVVVWLLFLGLGVWAASIVAKRFDRKLTHDHAATWAFWVTLAIGLPACLVEPPLGLETWAALGLPAFTFGALHHWWYWYRGAGDRRIRHQEDVDARLATYASSKPYWSSKILTEAMQTIATTLMKTYEKGDASQLSAVLAPPMVAYELLKLQFLAMTNTTVQTSRTRLQLARVVDVSPDSSSEEWLVVDVAFSVDSKVLTRRGEKTHTEPDSFDNTETWRVVRKQDNWVLAGRQMRNVYEPGDEKQLVTNMQQFSAAHGFAFSRLGPDWMIPPAGELLPEGMDSIVFIANHAVGKQGEVLLQLYPLEREPVPHSGEKESRHFFVAQATIGKQCGNIAVLPNYRGPLILDTSPSKPIGTGYQKVDLEWPAFNKAFSVWAHEADQVTARELLNPEFMQSLQDMSPHVSLEVSGQHITVFTQTANPSMELITALYNLVQKAAASLEL